MTTTPKTQYAKSGDVSIAYQVAGEGPFDLVMVPGFVSHVEMVWEMPLAARVLERFAKFSRLILFDKRGTGLSDPVIGAPTLEERMDDVRAVMDAAGSERAALLGVSEGAPMSILFGATYPQRTTALVLYGGMARTTEADDYPFAAPADALMQSSMEMAEYIGEGIMLEVMAPTIAEMPGAREMFMRFQRYAATPAMMVQMFTMFLDIDVRAILPTVHVPTLVLHRRGDRAVNRRAGKWMADQIAGAKFVELPGPDHMMFAGDTDTLVDEIEEFLTGARRATEPDRVLATVMFTDIVGSTEKAAALGDTLWRDVLERHHTLVAKELERFRGREVKQLGDGFLATFDGPARAIRCGQALAQSSEAAGLPIRVGLHTGEVEIMGDDVGGIAVHIAARVGAKAATGEVLVSSTVKDLVVGSGIAFADRGEHQLKGIPDEWRLFAVQG
ncbi:MAG: adenylate/guanylate cyclase domain-containing protein [Actinomycetota bacterium]